jgi:hypothetical protein
MARRPRNAAPPATETLGIAPAAVDEGFPVNQDGFPLDAEEVLPASNADVNEQPIEPVEGEDGGAEELHGMDPEEYENAISQGIAAAEHYIDSEVSPEREMLARYYACDPTTLPADAGRSAIISPEVRTTVLGHMPSMMRKFAGPERYAEFQAHPGTPQEQADFQTEYVRFVIMRDSPGYIHTQAMLDDALRRRTGICTWWWEEKEQVTRETFSGLDENAFALLQMEADDHSSDDDNIEYVVTITDRVPDETQEGGSLLPDQFSELQPDDHAALAQGGQPVPQTFIYSGYLERRFIRGRARWRAVPPEEFIIAPTSSADVDSYGLIGTRENKTISELVALGHDEAEIRELLQAPGGSNNQTSLDMNPERMQRDDVAGLERIFDVGFADVDPSLEKVKYCVVFVLIDKDGDGIAERRKICTVGDNNKIIYDEIYEDDMVPFGLICPYPEPHAPFGFSASDMALDIQEVKSELIRGTIDSLAESLSSRLAFQQGKVNVDDIMNTARGAAIRTTDIPSNVIQNLAAPFNGANTMPVIAYIDEERNKRTGTNPASPTGFDPDSTQSTAREAIGSLIDSSQERNEYIARNFAETGFSRLMRGIRNLLLRHQDHRRIIRLNGEDVAVDPRTWNADVDCVVADAGRTNSTKLIQNLLQVLAMQKEIYTTYGPNNGVVSLQNISYTYSTILRAQGFSDPTRFMAKVTPELEANLKAEAAKKAAQPTPEQLLAQVQTQKNQMDFAAKMAAIKSQMDKAILADDQKRDQAEMTFATAAAKIMGDFGIKIDEAHVRQLMEANNQGSAMADSVVAEQQAAQQPQQQPGGNGQQ